MILINCNLFKQIEYLSIQDVLALDSDRLIVKNQAAYVEKELTKSWMLLQTQIHANFEQIKTVQAEIAQLEQYAKMVNCS